MDAILQNTYFEESLSDRVGVANALTPQQAQCIFDWVKDYWLFKWTDAHNDCEDRANAICILLDQWQIPNYKAWVFSGSFLKGEFGTLRNLWNYHVASAIPVLINDIVYHYVLDPSTLIKAESIDIWAANVTEQPYSYYLIKWGSYYIFPAEFIDRDNWHWRDKENYQWTIEGLAGINGVAPDGDYYKYLLKKQIEKTKVEFNKLKNEECPFKFCFK